MYTTIEADIKNGWIKSAEARKIPEEAHVLITFLSQTQATPSFESSATASLRGRLGKYANSRLIEQEKSAWRQAVECKHEAN